MTQSLAGIEPVVGRGDDVSLDLSGRSSMADTVASLPDPVAAERFQSAMAEFGTDFGRAVSSKPPEAQNVLLKPSEVKDDAVGAFISSERIECHGQLNAGCERNLPEKDVSVGRDVPIAPKNTDGVPMRRRDDAPQSGFMPFVSQKDAPLATQEAESTAIDELPCQIVNASESVPKTASLVQDTVVGSSVPLDRVEPPSAKDVLRESPNMVGDYIQKMEFGGAEVGRVVSLKPPDVKDSVVGAFISPERSEYHGQLNAGGERALPEKGVSVDVSERALPEKNVLIGREALVAPQNQDGMPMWRHENLPTYQNIARLHEMLSDSHEPVQVIAPAPLPIELPSATVQQQPSAVATPDVVRMFVAAAEAVADAILVSSGFENGEGRILVRLQPEVLGGSEVQITAKGGTLTVVVNPASQDVQTIVEANRTQFEQHLAEKVNSWRVAVAVKRGEKTDERV